MPVPDRDHLAPLLRGRIGKFAYRAFYRRRWPQGLQQRDFSARRACSIVAPGAAASSRSQPGRMENSKTSRTIVLSCRQAPWRSLLLSLLTLTLLFLSAISATAGEREKALLKAHHGGQPDGLDRGGIIP